MTLEIKGLEIPDADDLQKFKNGDWWFQWCCDCGLRHLWHFEIVRGKSPKSDEVHVRGCADEWATKARKRITKLMKPKKRKAAKPKKKLKRRKK